LALSTYVYRGAIVNELLFQETTNRLLTKKMKIMKNPIYLFIGLAVLFHLFGQIYSSTLKSLVPVLQRYIYKSVSPTEFLHRNFPAVMRHFSKWIHVQSESRMATSVWNNGNSRWKSDESKLQHGESKGNHGKTE
jgi:hypothetical protein